MKHRYMLIGLYFLSAMFARAQSTQYQVGPVLDQQLQPPAVVTFQLQEYLMKQVPGLPTPSGAEAWTAEAERIRKHLLQDVVFHGWPEEWVTAPPKFEDLGPITTGK